MWTPFTLPTAKIRNWKEVQDSLQNCQKWKYVNTRVFWQGSPSLTWKSRGTRAPTHLWNQRCPQMVSNAPLNLQMSPVQSEITCEHQAGAVWQRQPPFHPGRRSNLSTNHSNFFYWPIAVTFFLFFIDKFLQLEGPSPQAACNLGFSPLLCIFLQYVLKLLAWEHAWYSLNSGWFVWLFPTAVFSNVPSFHLGQLAQSVDQSVQLWAKETFTTRATWQDRGIIIFTTRVTYHLTHGRINNVSHDRK